MPNTGNALRIELLGNVRAWRGDEEIALGPAQQRAVFAVLAYQANRIVSRNELINAVWGTSPPASAEGSIYTYISGLRRRLDPDRSRKSSDSVLASPSGGYLLQLPPDAVDIHVFEALHEQAQEHTANGRHDTAAELLAEARQLWRGDAFAQVPGPYAELERERLGELWLITSERWAAAALELGQHSEVAAVLSPLVREHPLREGLREHLMVALYRSGRHPEALATFREARDALVDELGIEPGLALRRVHERILAHDPALDAPSATAAVRAGSLSILPARVSRAWQDDYPVAPFVGRTTEIDRVRALISRLLDGSGHAVWIEGEPGIGKSELLTIGLSEAEQRGCQVAWAVADELGQRFPLQVMMECLGIDTKSPDRRRAALAEELHGESTRQSWGESDPALATVDRLLELVDEICSHAPLVLVVDDMQWADEASVLVWHRLATAIRQLPLLLIAASRPAPGRDELGQLRRGIKARDGDVMLLAPLADTDTEKLISEIIGARPGPGLRKLAAQAGGNPLYTREMVDSLVRANALTHTVGTADVDRLSVEDAPRSLVAAVGRTLGFLSDNTRDVLRWAALLGMEFAVGDVATATGKPAFELVGAFDEAIRAEVVLDADPLLVFRHPLLREALYDGIPGGMRVALHRQAAEALAGAGAPVKQVAEQLVAAPTAVDPWVVEWLAANSVALSRRAPLIAVELFERVLEHCTAADPNREVLLVSLVKVLFRLGRNPESRARQAFALAADPNRQGEMRQLLAAILHRRGQTEAAIQILGEAANDPMVPKFWRTRHCSLLTNLRRGDLTDLDATERNGREAYAEAQVSGELYPLAHSLQTLWLVSSVRRDHAQALEHVTDALKVIEPHRYDESLSELHVDLLDNRLFTLQNLDRLDEAGTMLRAAREIAADHLRSSSLHVSEAVHRFWLGQWDEALIELEALTEDGPAINFYGLREPGPTLLLLHGVAALVAGHRDDRARAAAHIDAAEEYAPSTGAERESCDFLVVAQALHAEQRGETDRAMSLLRPILNPTFAKMMLRHQWLPDVVRLALDHGDVDNAHRAAEICQEEADAEVVPARAFAAAARCRALLSGDPEPALWAASHFRSVGRTFELATALEDAAVLLARAELRGEAQQAFDESVAIFTKLAARWDIQRAETRMRPLGIHRRAFVPPPRPSAGWEALSSVEARIAALVAAGRSNPDIAATLVLPRRTVQAHITRILGKLDKHSRRGIAEEVLRCAEVSPAQLASFRD